MSYNWSNCADTLMRSWLTGVTMGAALSVFISPHWLRSRSQSESPKKVVTVENDPFGETSTFEEKTTKKTQSERLKTETQTKQTIQGQKLSIGTRLYLQGRVAARSSILFGVLFAMVGTFRCF